MIAGHEANAAQAQAIAAQLTQMAAAVVKTKMAVNAAAQEVQHEVEALQALPFGNKQELIESRIKMGLSQNIATVTASTTELASALGTTANIPQMTTPRRRRRNRPFRKAPIKVPRWPCRWPASSRRCSGSSPRCWGRFPNSSRSRCSS